MNICIATIPSLNISIRVQKALAREKIYGRIISIDPSISKNGCAYGIEFSCSEERAVKSVLRREGVRSPQFIRNER